VLGVAGYHKNKKSTASTILVDPFHIADVVGLADHIARLQIEALDSGYPDDETLGFEIFRYCQRSGAIPNRLKFNECRLQFNTCLGMARVVSKDYCALAESHELWLEIEKLRSK